VDSFRFANHSGANRKVNTSPFLVPYPSGAERVLVNSMASAFLDPRDSATTLGDSQTLGRYWRASANMSRQNDIFQN